MTPGARRLTLFLLTLMYAFGFIDRIVIALVAQGMKADLQLSDLQIGLLGGSLFALVNALVALPLARLSERISRSRVVAGSLLLGSAFAALCGAAANFSQLLLLRMGMAVGSAGTEAPAHSMISDMYEASRRASALALFTLGVPVASIVGSYVGGALGESYGWRATFWAFGSIGGLVAVAGLFVLHEPQRGAVSETADVGSVGSIARRLWTKPYFRQLLLGTCIGLVASFGINTFLPSFLMRNYGLGGAQAGLLFGLITGLASAVGALAGGFGAERLARRHPAWLLGGPAIGLAIGAPLLIFGVTRHDLTFATSILMIASCFFYTWLGPAIAVTHGLLDSRSRATGSALFLLCMHLVGQGLGPPLLGFASDAFAAWHFGSSQFSALCTGATSTAVSSQCALASAAGVRDAIVLSAFVFLWAGFHLALGAYARRREANDSIGAGATA